MLAGVPQGSILGPLFLVYIYIYINNLSKNLSSITKLFADDTICSVVHDINLSSLQLNDWKMSLNPEVTKQAQEAVLYHESQRVTHPTVYFNNSTVTQSSSQKHLGIHLGEKLNFIHHIKEKSYKTNKGVGVIKILKSQNLRDQQVVLVTIPNCPDFFSVFRYYKDLISCEIFSKNLLQLWSYDCSKISQFLGGLLFLFFFLTLGKFF